MSAPVDLSTAAGWNQTAADWRRLDRVFVKRIDGRIVATSSVVTAGGVSWIGMMLVESRLRGRGLGGAMLRRALAACRGAVGLDATDLGRPLYLKAGFRDVAPIVRWGGVLRARGRLPRARLAEVLALDPLDRGALLSRLWSESIGWVVPGRGYALLRPGRLAAQLGPVVAFDEAALEALLGAAGGRRVIVDAFGDARALRRAGLVPQRRLMRMSLGGDRLLMGRGVRAAAGLELG